MLFKMLRGAFDLAKAPFQKNEYTRALERMEHLRKHFGGDEGAKELREYRQLEALCQKHENKAKTKLAPAVQP